MEGLMSFSHIFVAVFITYFATYIVNPAKTDVTMSALCPGLDECSLAIYLTGIQNAIVGVGTIVMMPVIGSLSDKYGRKTLLTFPMALSIIPFAILAYKRTKAYFYAYYVMYILTAMVSNGTVNCIALAYLADNISESKRTTAFSILLGVGSAANLSSTFTARFISDAAAFQVATGASTIALVYMRIFVKESLPRVKDDLTEPILTSGLENAKNGEPQKKTTFFQKIPALGDIISLMKSSTTLLQAAVVVFCLGLSDGGLQSTLNYFLKDVFHYGKDQFADTSLILSVLQMVEQIFLLPLLVPIISEKMLLSIGVFAEFMSIMIWGLSWSSWVPYLASVIASFAAFTGPSVKSIASKQAGPLVQGKVQGYIAGATSFGNIISPLIFSPLAALFLSDKAPFDFPGFCIVCIGIASLIAFIQSVFIKPTHPIQSNEINVDIDTEAASSQ